MSPALPGRHLLRWAHVLFEPQQVERFLSPGIADMQHEWQRSLVNHDAAGCFRAKRAGYCQFACAVAWLVAAGHVAQLRRLQWMLFVPAMVAALMGIWGLQQAHAQRFSMLQIIWLAIALLASCAIGSVPARWFRALVVPLGIGSVVLLAWTAVAGQSYEGATRWLSAGPLTLRSSYLAAPWLVATVAACAGSGRRRLALAVALGAQALLIAMPDGEVAVPLAAACIAALAGAGVPKRMLAVSSATQVLAAAVALSRGPALPPVPHVHQLFGLLSQFGLPAVVAMGALLFLMGALVVMAVRARRRDQQAKALMFGSVVLIAGWLVLPVFVADAAVPLLGYGGSPVVAFFLAIGMVARHSGLKSHGTRPAAGL